MDATSSQTGSRAEADFYARLPVTYPRALEDTPAILHPVLRIVFRYLITRGAFPNGKTTPAMNPEAGPLTPNVYWVRNNRWAQVTSFESGKPRVLLDRAMRETLKRL